MEPPPTSPAGVVGATLGHEASSGAARLTLREQLALSALWLGLNFQSSALLPIVVPTQMLLLVDRGAVASSQQALAVSLFSALAAVVAIVVTPLSGAASDRLARRSKNRNQLIVAAILIALMGQAGLAATAPLIIFVAAFAIVQVGTNAATAAYQGLLPDLVPSSQRGAASGWLGFMTIIGSVGSLGTAGLLLSDVSAGPRLESEVVHGSAIFYLIAAAVLVVTMLATVLGVRARRPELAPDREASWTAVIKHQPFRVVFAARFFVMIGLTLFLTYIEYYLASVNGATSFVGATVSVALLALLGALTSSLFLGIASDRVPRVNIVVGANLLMAAAAAFFVFAPPQLPLAPLGLLFGLGYGAYLSVDWALAIDSLPSRATSARDLGVFTVSSNLPALVAPLLGGLVILGAGWLGAPGLAYRAIFTLAAVSLVVGMLVVRRIRFAGN